MTTGSENKGQIQPDLSQASAFEALLNAAKAAPMPPVEQWDPPYCGDVGFEIRRDGTWCYQSSPIGRKPLVRLFSRVLRRDPDDRYYLVTPVEKVLVEVEDAPFLAVEMEVTGQGRNQVIAFRTNVDDVVICGPDHPLRFVSEPAGGQKPYVRVRGRLDALVTRAVYYDLMTHVVELAAEDAHAMENPSPGSVPQLGLWSNGAWFALS